MPKSNVTQKPPPPKYSPYDNRPASSAPTGRASQISNAVPFEEIEDGRFYNASISFTPTVAGGRTPGSIPKHRVLVNRVERGDKPSVELYYVTTFGGRSPTAFHGRHNDDWRMYLPMAPEQQIGYLSLSSVPPVIRGWLNFARPMLIRYSSDLSGSKKLRHPPESLGVAVPLPHGPVIIMDWGAQYIKAMKSSWNKTMDSTKVINQNRWPGCAELLHDTFLPQKDAGHDLNPERSSDEDGEEWLGITGLLDGTHDDDEAEGGSNDMVGISRSMTHGAAENATPHRQSGSLPPTPPHARPYLTAPSRAIPPTLPLTPPERNPTHSLPEPTFPSFTKPQDTPVGSQTVSPTTPRLTACTDHKYDEYIATVILSEILPGEEGIEDPPPDVYTTVLCGRPRPYLGLE